MSLLLLGAAIILVAGLAQAGPGHALLRDAGLYEAPASYTSLAFTSPRGLPSALVSAKKPIDVSFSIHNVSAASRTYSWAILVVQGHKSQVKTEGLVDVPAEGRHSITRPVSAACTAAQLQVVVRLSSPAETISFWVSCPRQRTAR